MTLLEAEQGRHYRIEAVCTGPEQSRDEGETFGRGEKDAGGKECSGQSGRRFLRRETAGRLVALGLVRGTDVAILHKKRTGTLILRVRGTRLALGWGIAGGIQVSEAGGP